MYNRTFIFIVLSICSPKVILDNYTARPINRVLNNFQIHDGEKRNKPGKQLQFEVIDEAG